jgi:hypothetical protein
LDKWFKKSISHHFNVNFILLRILLGYFCSTGGLLLCSTFTFWVQLFCSTLFGLGLFYLAKIIVGYIAPTIDYLILKVVDLVKWLFYNDDNEQEISNNVQSLQHDSHLNGNTGYLTVKKCQRENCKNKANILIIHEKNSHIDYCQSCWEKYYKQDSIFNNSCPICIDNLLYVEILDDLNEKPCYNGSCDNCIFIGQCGCDICEDGCSNTINTLNVHLRKNEKQCLTKCLGCVNNENCTPINSQKNYIIL